MCTTMIGTGLCRRNEKGRARYTIVSNEEIAVGVWEIIFESPEIATHARPGQFVNVYCRHKGQLLPRPISICEVDRTKGRIHLVYALRGKGTQEFACYQPGESIDILGPLGNGFPLEEAGESNLIIGGGVGTPPLVELCKQLSGDKTIVVSFRSNPYLISRLKRYGKVFVATRDGSVGLQGNALKIVTEKGLRGTIFACGPGAMLAAVQKYAHEKALPAFLSLEERMGCGFGGCVCCVTKIRSDSGGTSTYKKVCKEGPVFPAEEVVFS